MIQLLKRLDGAVDQNPQSNAQYLSASWQWLELLRKILRTGLVANPRGKETLEILNEVQLQVQMRSPVVAVKDRRLNYKFMATEAAWICSGRDDLETLVRVNSRMAAFSDDGKTLAGAYGPRFVQQLDYVVQTLLNDQMTRQATITLWQPNPRPSKDIPCTVALNFSIRRQKLHLHVFMRSSDAWLGVPYDLFSFTCMAACVLGHVNAALPGDERCDLGILTLTPSSSHLYAEHFDAAEELVRQWCSEGITVGTCMPLPSPQSRLDWDSLFLQLMLAGSTTEYPEFGYTPRPLF